MLKPVLDFDYPDIDIETEITEDPDVITFHTNLALTTAGAESYASPDELEEGSPVAQALALVGGIAALRLDGGEMHVRREPGWEWHHLVADISAALKEFFL